MSSYKIRRGTRTGVKIWRAVSSGTGQHIIPDGVMDLMWFQNRLVVAGADTRSMVAATQPGEETWGVQLAPGTVHALLGVSASELTDQRVELSELVPVPERLIDPFAGNAADALEQVFVTLWTKANPDRSVLREAESLDQSARQGHSVREIARLHNRSERSLRRLSDRLFGYSPKTLMQIHRFQGALCLTREGLSLSRAAAVAGYVDQAHFNREAKRLTGQTPFELSQN